MVDNKRILITGCGSLAKALTKDFILNHKPKAIRLYSRDEYLQHQAKEEIHDPNDIVGYFIGDVRDSARLALAMRGVDIVIHTAAMKRVEVCEYNPIEAVRTNILGTINVIVQCVDHNVERAVFVSTDKAVMPVNLYGGTKFVAEKVWLHANVYRPIFNAVRYGNVMDSRGSVLPMFRKIAKEKEVFPVTDEGMTRFLVDMGEAVKLIKTSLKGTSGTVFVLNSPTAKIVDIAKALYARAKFKVVGVRPGEKIHEVLVSEYDTNVEVVGGPTDVPLTSDLNNLSIAELREMLK